ncbi:helix-turn-helix transcriptional regulator [Ralstonia insidiosa]|uniref:helix-turn-helix transcriptional regulator n=1 Tax=Ralstonia insidiosa TaxID=190721 RepID=UPI000CEF3084|nr:AlpA family phage regulatory protein [Ralstonia insidiosa]
MAYLQASPTNVTAPNTAAAIPHYHRLLKRNQVLDRTGLSNSVMYELIARGLFPKPIKPTGGRMSAWVEQEVELFIAQRIEARDNA